MKKYVLIDNGIVTQIQPYHEDGFIEIEDDVSVVCGMAYDGTSFSLPPKTFLELKNQKLAALNDQFNIRSLRPRVDVASLGYAVDGSRADLDNFKNGRDVLYPYIKDADNDIHPATLPDYDAVIRAVQENGASLIAWLWSKKDEINTIEVNENTTEDQAIAALEAVVIS